jgi:D-amino peptidase
MRISLRISLAAIALIAGAASLHAQRGLKVYISADMEGITGVASVDQLGPANFEYQQARQWMTGEVLAAIQGAREAGATEFVISDSHGNGESLLIDRFPNDIPITIVRSFPRPLGMMEGIDSSFAAVIFIGYHASTSSTTGVRAHTMSSALLTRIAINGTSMSEAGVNAAIAAEYGVPVVMITGDDQIVAESKQRFGPIEGVAVKRAIGFHSAATMTPEAGQALIRQHAKVAVGRRAEMRPYRMARPLSLEVSFKNYRPVELLGYLSNVQRIDSHTVRYAPRDMLDLSKFLEFITNYDATLTP